MNTVVNVRVFDKFCNGCVRNKKDIMVSFEVTGDRKIDENVLRWKDYFLTNEQASELILELQQQLFNNSRGDLESRGVVKTL